tara:strand:+ start:146 stop:550 length:405 start_codon:yes stop_codon:yes gene_type:complete
MDHVYLIQEREFIRLNEETYTVGKTSESLEKAMNALPLGSRLIYFCNVSDCHNVFRNICNTFDHLFERRIEYGNTYYTGELETMKKEFLIGIINDVYGTETEIIDIEEQSESNESMLRLVGRTSVMRLKETTNI